MTTSLDLIDQISRTGNYSHIEFQMETLDPPSDMLPEKKLMAAILLEAIRGLNMGGEIGRDAARWMARTDDDIFGFASICDALKLDPSAVRSHFATGIAKSRAYRKYGCTVVPDDPNASHKYIKQTHCSECQNRYYQAYRTRLTGRFIRRPGRPAKLVLPEMQGADHEFIGQHHCILCRRHYQRFYRTVPRPEMEVDEMD